MYEDCAPNRPKKIPDVEQEKKEPEKMFKRCFEIVY